MRWRKQGTPSWTHWDTSLEGEGEDELVLIAAHDGGQKYCCEECAVSLYRRRYVLVGPVPRTRETDRRYCLEHSPTPIEIMEEGTG